MSKPLETLPQTYLEGTDFKVRDSVVSLARYEPTQPCSALSEALIDQAFSGACQCHEAGAFFFATMRCVVRRQCKVQ